MEASPSSPLEVPEADFLLQFLIIAFDTPSKLGDVDHAGECDVLGKRGQRIFGWLLFALGPLDQQPFFGPRIIGWKGVTMSGPDANPCEA